MHAELEHTVARNTRATRTAFVAFDLLSDGDRSLVALPWSERRRALEARVPAGRKGIVRRGESVRCGSAAARRLFERARTEGWEGVLLKRVDAPYAAGRRTPDWRKVKLEREQEFVIGGYTAPTEGAARDHFGALLVGFYDDHGRLHYAGKVGTGYTMTTLAMLARRLAPLRRATSPFVDTPRATRTATTWVRPELVAQVRYNEMTEAGILRQPSFLGLRDDKAARDVRLESTSSAAAAVTNGMRCAS
jgi:bifunctional non-homologous end joining protein LigD